MKRSKFTETQIAKTNEAGRKVEDISRELGTSTATFYLWRKKYGGMEASHLKRLKELEAEKIRPKRMYTDQAIELEMPRMSFQKSDRAFCETYCVLVFSRSI